MGGRGTAAARRFGPGLAAACWLSACAAAVPVPGPAGTAPIDTGEKVQTASVLVADGQARAPATAAAPARASGAVVTPDGTWDCGIAVPPIGDWEIETGFADPGAGSFQKAADLARAKLLERLCGHSVACASLEGHVKPWKTGEGQGRVCAMVVVDVKDLDRWRGEWISLKGLDDQLAAAAKQLLSPDGKLARKRVAVAVDRIVDGNAAGGPRADWLRLRMEGALQRAGALVSEVPKGYSGIGIPKGFDLVLEARLVPRREQRIPVLEVLWVARAKDRSGLMAKRLSSPVVFVEALSPATVELAELPESDAGLSIHLDSRAGGSLCRGERTQLWLESATATHVRVFNLYGKDRALLLFPNSEQPDDRVAAGKPVALGGPHGFEAEPFPGAEAEQFLVIASDRPDGFGPVGLAPGVCRVEPALVAKLRTREGLPQGLRFATDGFRIAADGSCTRKIAPQDPATVATSLAQLPVCR